MFASNGVRVAMRQRALCHPARSTSCLVVVLALLLFRCDSSGAEDMSNRVHRSNRLGMLAWDCSTTYCGKGTTGLDLWLSLQQVV